MFDWEWGGRFNDVSDIRCLRMWRSEELMVCKLRSSQCRLWSQSYGAQFIVGRWMPIAMMTTKQYAVPVYTSVKYVIESEEELLMMRVCNSRYAPYGCGGATSWRHSQILHATFHSATRLYSGPLVRCDHGSSPCSLLSSCNLPPRCHLHNMSFLPRSIIGSSNGDKTETASFS